MQIVQVSPALLACLYRVHLVAAGWALWGFRTCQTFGAGPLVVCSVLLSALSLCLWCVVFEYGSISRFKAFLARFGAFVWVCVGLVIFVACVAFVRVWS